MTQADGDRPVLVDHSHVEMGDPASVDLAPIIAAIAAAEELALDMPYECPDCGELHDGATTGTEWCPSCADEL